jgi:hypothetical protein
VNGYAAGPPQATFDPRLLAGGALLASSPAPPRQRDRHPIIDTKSGFSRISDVVYKPVIGSASFNGGRRLPTSARLNVSQRICELHEYWKWRVGHEPRAATDPLSFSATTEITLARFSN